MSKRVKRPGVRQGYDLWAETYDATPNPLVALDRRVTPRTITWMTRSFRKCHERASI